MKKSYPSLRPWQVNMVLENHDKQTAAQLAVKAKMPVDKVYEICRDHGKKPLSPSQFKQSLHGAPVISKLVAFGDEPKKLINRPPARYDNIPSPYGIASDLHKEK